MSKFKLPPVSPLIGSGLFNYFKIIFNNKISPRYYLHVIITFIIILLASPFHLIDHIIFKYRLRKFTLKKDPIFIIGHWRSGTTFLHNLICKDKSFAFLNTYNSLFINNLYSSFLFKTLMNKIMPKQRPSDGMKLGVDLPQEDEFAVTNFYNISHYLFFYFPNNYKKYYNEAIKFQSNSINENKWIANYDKIIKRILLYMNKKQILIKNPSNTSRISSILSKYPDAKFIHIHRNPYYVYLSTYKFFYELFPSVNLQVVKDDTIHKLILYNYKNMYNDYFKQYKFIPKRNLIDIKFNDFKENPLDIIKNIYDKFSIRTYDTSKQDFINYIDENSSHKMNTYKIKKDRLLEIKNEFSIIIKKLKYTVPKNLEIIN